MKYIVNPVNNKDLETFLHSNDITDILIGVDYLTHGIGLKLKVEKLNKILKKTNKISLDISRLFHEKELTIINEILDKINFEKVNLIFYSDFGLYMLLKEKGLEKKAVYNAYTYTTNVSDINFYNDINNYVCVSNQISSDELRYLLEKSNKKAIVYGFGKSIIFYSKRELLTNYFKYRGLNDNPHSKSYYLKEEFRDDLYHIYEDEFGAYIYEAGYYYLFEELENMKNIEYVILDASDLDSKNYRKVVNAYLNKNKEILLGLDIKLYKGIMQEKSVLLKSEVTNHE